MVLKDVLLQFVSVSFVVEVLRVEEESTSVCSSTGCQVVYHFPVAE